MSIWLVGRAAPGTFDRKHHSLRRVRRPKARALHFEGLESRNLLSISGFVYVEINGNGTDDDTDPGLQGVVVTLNGVDANNNPPPTQTTTTGSDGSYQYSGASAGAYTLTEAQPASFVDGSVTIGSLGGVSGPNIVAKVVVPAGVDGTNCLD